MRGGEVGVGKPEGEDEVPFCRHIAETAASPRSHNRNANPFANNQNQHHGIEPARPPARNAAKRAAEEDRNTCHLFRRDAPAPSLPRRPLLDA